MRVLRRWFESYHAEEGLPSIEGLLQDVRYAARVLLKSRAFTVVASISLALAIGANTTIFSVAKQLLYERLAVPQPANLRLLTWTGARDRIAVHGGYNYDSLPGGRIVSADFSYPVYQQLRAQNQVLGDLLIFHVTGMNATVGDDAQRVTAHEVSGNYYSVLGVRPQLGRGIEPSDDTAASQPVVVISDEFWASEFGRSPAALGRSMRLNDVPVIIIGVNPKGFTGAESTLPADTPAVTVPLAHAQILTPASDGAKLLANPADWGGLSILGRTRAGVSDSAAQAALDTQLSAIVRATMPVRAGEQMPRLVLRDGSRGLFGQKQIFATPMSVLMMFVGLVLLLACANIANLMLARGAQRRREMSVRLALGAGRARILRQMLVESLLLASIGGAGGLAIGYWGRTAIPRLTNVWDLAAFSVRFDWQVFAFTAAVTIFTGVLFGLAPAFAATRADITHGLKEGGRTATRGRRGFAGKSLAAFQIALSTLLVIGAGLFVRSLAGLNRVDPGFRTGHLLLAQIVLPQNRYPAGANIAFHRRLEQSIAAMPGVRSISAAEYPYLSHDVSDIDFLPQSEASDPSSHHAEAYNAVGIHFFETLGIPIVAGRAFGAEDTAASPKVGIINQALAKTRFPNRNPIGMRFSMGTYGGYGDVLTSHPIEIVGVCRDTLHADLNTPAPPQVFVPYIQQTSIRRLTYEIRTRTTPESIIPALRRVVHAADPELPLVHVRSQQEQIDTDLEEQRLFVTLTSGFGMLALVLASVGIYGVMAYSVAQRTNEIGIRMALGAIPRQVLAMVLREASWLSAAGVAAGVGASVLLSRVVKSMLFGIAPYDPATLWGAVLLLLIVALGASWIPARRAARVQPMQALRRD